MAKKIGEGALGRAGRLGLSELGNAFVLSKGRDSIADRENVPPENVQESGGIGAVVQSVVGSALTINALRELAKTHDRDKNPDRERKHTKEKERGDRER